MAQEFGEEMAQHKG